MDTKQNALLTEYKVLRDEIISTYTKGATLMRFTWGGIAGITFAAVKFEIPELIFIAILLSITTWRERFNGTESVGKIGGYIQAVIEPQVEGLQWESMLHSVNETSKFIKNTQKGKFLHLITTRNGYAVIVSIIAFAYYYPATYKCVDIWYIAIMCLSLYLFCRTIKYGADCYGARVRWLKKFTKEYQKMES